jgi:hypothetical protein
MDISVVLDLTGLDMIYQDYGLKAYLLSEPHSFQELISHISKQKKSSNFKHQTSMEKIMVMYSKATSMPQSQETILSEELVMISFLYTSTQSMAPLLVP